MGLLYDKQLASKFKITFNGGALPPVGTKLKMESIKFYGQVSSHFE